MVPPTAHGVAFHDNRVWALMLVARRRPRAESPRGFNRSSQRCGQHSRWRPVAQGLAGTLVEPLRDAVQVSLRVHRQVHIERRSTDERRRRAASSLSGVSAALAPRAPRGRCCGAARGTLRRPALTGPSSDTVTPREDALRSDRATPRRRSNSATSLATQTGRARRSVSATLAWTSSRSWRPHGQDRRARRPVHQRSRCQTSVSKLACFGEEVGEFRFVTSGRHVPFQQFCDAD